jgi:hypothetical protein
LSRGPSSFRQSDVTRALRAAREAGFDRVEFDPVTGRYMFKNDGQQQTQAEPNNFFDEKLKDDHTGTAERSSVQEPARQVANLLPRRRP